jgi:hypothetical protein
MLLRPARILLWAAALSCVAAFVGPPQPQPQPLVFFATADWGGMEAEPYTTPGQLAAAQAMGTISAASGSHPAFVLAAGDNFYMVSACILAVLQDIAAEPPPRMGFRHRCRT